MRMKGLFYVLASHMMWTGRGVLVTSQSPCRLLNGELDDHTRQAEMAVMELLEAKEPAQRKRAADGSWRPPQASAPFNIHAPREAVLPVAVLRLDSLYSRLSPPPISLIRHPQVRVCIIWCISMPMSHTLVLSSSHSWCLSRGDLHASVSLALTRSLPYAENYMARHCLVHGR